MGQSLGIDRVAVMLEDQLSGSPINLDQEIAVGIERDEALGEALIENIDRLGDRSC